MATSRGKKKVEPGTFEPGLPTDTMEVVRLFAIAGRAVIAKPNVLENVTETLAAIIQQLVPPEKLAAEECARLWGLFARVAQLAKPALLTEGGRALYRDLDGIGQKLSLPPLDSWSSLPEGILAKNPVRLATESTDRGDSLEKVRKKAITKGRLTKDPPLKAVEVLKLVSGMASYSRDELFRQMVGAGMLQKSDTSLIGQVIQRGGKISKGDELLADGLEQIGRWLVKK